MTDEQSHELCQRCFGTKLIVDDNDSTYRPCPEPVLELYVVARPTGNVRLRCMNGHYCVRVLVCTGTEAVFPPEVRSCDCGARWDWEYAPRDLRTTIHDGWPDSKKFRARVPSDDGEVFGKAWADTWEEAVALAKKELEIKLR